MRNRIVSFFMGIIILSYSCDPPGDERMHIINDSSDTVYFYYTVGRSLPDKNPFDDNNPSTEQSVNANHHNLSSYVLLPHENKIIATGTGKWDPEITNPYSDNSITFFTFSPQTVHDTAWSTIKQKRLYKVHKFTWDQILKSEWQLKMSPNK